MIRREIPHLTPLTYIFWVLLDQKGNETQYFNIISKQWLLILNDDEELKNNITNQMHFASFHRFCKQLLKYPNNPLKPLIEAVELKISLQSLRDFKRLLRLSLSEFREEFSVGSLTQDMLMDLINSIPVIAQNNRLYSKPFYDLLRCFDIEIYKYKELICQKISSINLNTKKLVIFTPEDINKMLGLLPLEPNLSPSDVKEISLILKFGYLTALRIMSILSIPREAMIDLNKMAALTSINSKNCKTPFRGKLFAEAIQKDEKFLTLIAEADELLDAIHPNRELFFTFDEVSIRSKRLHNPYLKDNLMLFHGLRRGRLTELYKNGFSISALSLFAGHKSVDVTRRYLSTLAIEHELEECFAKFNSILC